MLLKFKLRMVFELNLLRGYFECINRYCCGFICLAGDVNRMTFVTTGFIRIGDGREFVPASSASLPAPDFTQLLMQLISFSEPALWAAPHLVSVMTPVNSPETLGKEDNQYSLHCGDLLLWLIFLYV